MAEEGRRLDELLAFLGPATRLDLRATALEFVLGLTGSEHGRGVLRQRHDVLKALFDLTAAVEPPLARDAHLALVNLSAADEFSEELISLGVFPRFLEFLTDPDWSCADQVCTTLSNLTRSEAGAESFVKTITVGGNISLYQLVDIFDRRGFNKQAHLHYLATIFSNITQVAVARLLFLDRSKCLIPRLLPYVQFKDSLIRRGGVAGLLRNLCFEVASHQWLLSDEVDILPALLLPLAGPEQFEEEVMDNLPADLQYLPDDQRREEDPDIRKMLLEAVTKLCATKFGREYLRKCQTYFILRELHKVEKDAEVADVCETLIHILIADEPEEGMENLEEVELPKGFTASRLTGPGSVVMTHADSSVPKKQS